MSATRFVQVGLVIAGVALGFAVRQEAGSASGATRCLDTFLAGSTGHVPTRAPLAGVDVDYRFVIPARFGGGGGAAAAEQNGARRPSSDAGPAGR